jgi:hypothetical protein
MSSSDQQYSEDQIWPEMKEKAEIWGATFCISRDEEIILASDFQNAAMNYLTRIIKDKKTESMSDNSQQQSKYAGAIWKKQITKKDGSGTVEVLNVKIGDQHYNAWPNTYKNAPNQPDYNLVIDEYQMKKQAEYKAQQGQQAPPLGAAGTGTAPTPGNSATPPPSGDVADDLPF